MPDNDNDNKKERGKVIPLWDRINSPEEILNSIVTDKNTALKKMNENHYFIHSYGGKPAVLSYIYNETFNKKIPDFSTPESIYIRYCNQTVETIGKNGNIVSEPLGQWWMKQPGREEFETVAFEPAKNRIYEINNSRILNMWEGFNIEPKKGNWIKTLKHLYKILYNGDREKFIYAFKWLAWTIQNPGQRAEVALVLKGKKGAGKSFFLTQFVDIFGRHGICISNPEHLTGKHNAHLQFVSFLFADEAYNPGNREVEGTLKQIITEPRFTIEPKFINARLTNNCLHIAMSTNSDWVIPADADERRFFINVVDNKYAKNQSPESIREKYFNDLAKELYKDGGREAMLYDLKNYQLGDWHPRFNVPHTEELQKQIYMSLSKVEKTIINFIDLGYFPGIKEDDHHYYITIGELFNYLEEMEPGAKNNNQRMIINLFEKLELKNVRRNARRVWIFPPLQVLREKWDDAVFKYNWTYSGEWEIEKQKY